MKRFSFLSFWTILLIGILFLSSDLFVDNKTTIKWYSLVFGTLLGSIILLFKDRKQSKFNIDLLTLLVVVLALYISLRLIFHIETFNVRLVYSLCILFLFFIFKFVKYNHTRIINIIIPTACSIQAVYGLLQYFHLLHPSGQYPIVGSFDNPAGFAACLSVGYPFALFSIDKTKWKKYLGIITIVTISLAIILSESRTGILTILCISIIYTFYKYRLLFTKWKKYIATGSIILTISILLGLFFLKKDSASGRLLIWKVSCEMIVNNPIFGSGDGSFHTDYMIYQADYFKDNPDSSFALLADNVLYPFNEYLAVAIEDGIIGLILVFVIILITVNYSYKEVPPYLLCLIAVCIFSFFSYPLRYPFIWLILAYSLAQLSRNTPVLFSFKINKLRYYSIKGIMFLFLCLCSYFLVKDIIFEYKWKKNTQLAFQGKSEKALPIYENLYNNWNGNSLFLYNYGAELNYIKDYSKSIAILLECEKYFNDYDVQMLLADNYYNLNKLDESEKHYTLASNMCPNRFLPLYWMMKIYDKKEQPKDALIMAHIIINKKVKIPSSTITRVKIDAKKRIENVRR